MKQHLRIPVAFFLLLSLCGTVAALAQFSALPLVTQATGSTGWQSKHFEKSPHAGLILDDKGDLVALDELLKRIRSAKFVLLGEIHPNADHHALQAALLSEVVRAGRKPAVVFEMVPQSLQPELDKIAAQPAMAMVDVSKALKWQERGWPDFAVYAPIFKVALEAGLPLVAGNLGRARIRDLARKGVGSLKPQEREDWALNVEFSAEQQKSLLQALKSGHCDMLPASALGHMVPVQRARDGLMAYALSNSGNKDGAVLIAGSGHVRRDRAVPWVISQLEPGATVVSVAMTELASADKLSDVDLKAIASQRPFDFVILTPRSEIKDHCAALKKRFEAHRKRKNQD